MNIIEILLNNLFPVHRAYASLGSSLSEKLQSLENANAANENDLVRIVTDIATPLSVICVVLLLIYGGYMLMSSKGDPDKLQEAKQVITNAIIGFVVILLCVAILILISNTLGLGIYG
jgi:heme/copper-type cytochrome/quinol oxidase subunit 2